MSKFEVCIAVVGLIAIAGLMISMVINPVRDAESTYPSGSPFRNAVLNRLRTDRSARVEASIAGVIGLLAILRVFIPIIHSFLRGR